MIETCWMFYVPLSRYSSFFFFLCIISIAQCNFTCYHLPKFTSHKVIVKTQHRKEERKRVLIQNARYIDAIFVFLLGRFSILHLEHRLHVLDGDLNLYTGLDGDGSDLLHDLSRGLQVNEALVNAHLKAIPSLGTFTARGLTGGDAENLGRHADRALDLELLLLGTTDEVSADLLEVLDVARGESNANAVNLRGISLLNSLLGSGFHNSGHLKIRKQGKGQKG